MLFVSRPNNLYVEPSPPTQLGETGNGKLDRGQDGAASGCELSGAMRGKQKLPPHGTAAFGVLRWSGWTDRRPGPIVQRQAELVIRRSPLTGRSDYAMKGQKPTKTNHLGVLARHKLPLGSTQSPATQVTHARRESAQF